MTALDDLLEQLPPADAPDAWTFGEVTATAPLTVRFNGTAAADAVAGPVALSTYTPAVGDKAVLIRLGPLWIAIGTLP